MILCAKCFYCIVLLLRLQFGIQSHEASQIDVALLECNLPEEDEEVQRLDLELLDFDFFDDESVIVGYRIADGESKCNKLTRLVWLIWAKAQGKRLYPW